MALRTVDVHWAAGFLEGEGSFTVCGTSPRVQATQVELQPLKKLVALFGGYVIPKKLGGLGKKPIHSWSLTSIKSISVMMMLYDLMSPSRQRQIEKAVTLWKARGARVGDRHYNSVMNDTEALAAMQRVHNGEGIVAVARSVGIHHTVLGMWMRGEKKPYLRLRLQGTGRYIPGRRSSSPSDAEALAAMRRVRNGEPVTAVARELGLVHTTMTLWLSGAHRPQLLAQLQREVGE